MRGVGSGEARPRILCVRPDHLGDVVLTLPALAALKEALPGARVCYLVPDAVRMVPERCPHVDRVISTTFPPCHGPGDVPGWPPDETVEELRGAHDVALLFRPDDPWSGALAQAAGLPVRIGFDQPRTRPYLTDVVGDRPALHVARLALTLVAAALRRFSSTPVDERLGVGGCVVPAADEEREAAAFLALSGGGDRPLLLHPGSGWALKNWPARRWGKVAGALAARYRVVPLVLGAPAERDLVDEVVAASEGAAVGSAGDLSLGALAALQRRALAVVGNDSGALHLAAMMGALVVSLFGPVAPWVFHPLSENRRDVWSALPCSPCGTLVRPPCGATSEPACISSISIDAVLAAIDEVIREPARR